MKRFWIILILAAMAACSGGKKKGLLLFPLSLASASAETVADSAGTATVEDTSAAAATETTSSDQVLAGIVAGNSDAEDLLIPMTTENPAAPDAESGSESGSGEENSSTSNPGSSSGAESDSSEAESSESSSSSSSSSSASDSSGAADSDGWPDETGDEAPTADDPYLPVADLCNANATFLAVAKGGSSEPKHSVDMAEYDLAMDPANCMTGRFRIAVDFNVTAIPDKGASFHVKILDVLGRQIGFINLKAHSTGIIQARGKITLSEPNQRILFTWEGGSAGRSGKAADTGLEILGVTLYAKRSSLK